MYETSNCKQVSPRGDLESVIGRVIPFQAFPSCAHISLAKVAILDKGFVTGRRRAGQWAARAGHHGWDASPLAAELCMRWISENDRFSIQRTPG